jgi:hypothetical protein
MQNLITRNRAAMAALARHFSTTWKEGADASHAYLQVGAKRVHITVALAKQRTGRNYAAAKPRLRFDRVALRFLSDLQRALRDEVPAGKTIVLTVTAPIRQSSKTAAALEREIRALLARNRTNAEIDDTINENQVRARIVAGSVRGAPNVIGFVHNPGPGAAAVLLDAAQLLVESLSTAPTRATAKPQTDRWLLIAGDAAPSHVAAYRDAYSQLGAASGFANVLLLAGGRIESLTG